ncbi:pyruvate, water dikinase [Raineyella antarctica]|uniref:Pyruvate, water dikinase n=1 Tax=Raineyella antarctica TaxID=1577474 RepID=A0A1G6HGA9_9ACTN|nr:PEP/pyruvate-binding domain-containing protein [Raineyella antarctica]SDB93204.1 pyruvate, water dikinase [Raineyella antarctica]
MAPLTLPLDAAAATLGSVGGKGLNLIRLTRAGFRVPPGFVVTTDAYTAHVGAHGLAEVIARATAGIDPGDAAALEAASTTIRSAFGAGAMPPEVRTAILAAAASRGSTPLAVRSSATAEDLPDLSFAGQQDTYLNVIGAEQLLGAVVDCWSSLWTARAIGYRLRNAIADSDVALAVVVQELLAPQASGVLFTADPLTGIRSRTVIDAVPGLGESLVSGQAEPDHWEVAADGTILSRTLGAKALVTVPAPGGGTTTVTPEQAAARTYVLTDAQVADLAALGRRIQDEYDNPQDIEWALVDGELHVLQTRAITSLFPLPPGGAEALWFSFGAFQGMLRPITPVGREALIRLASGAAVVFRGRPSDPEQQGFIAVVGERLWVRLDGLLRHPVGARLVPTMLAIGEPGTGAIIRRLRQEQGLPAARISPRTVGPRSMQPVLRFVGRVLAGLPLSLVAPAVRRRRFDRAIESMVTAAGDAQREATAEADPYARLSRRVDAAESSLLVGLARAFGQFAPVMGPAGMLLAVLHRIGRAAGPEADALVMATMRSMPGNPTTEMDLAMWHVADTIRHDPQAVALFEEADAAELADRYAAGRLPESVSSAVADFLATFGMRGVAEIDMGAPRWRDEPAQVFATLRSYLQMDPAVSPVAAYAAGIGASREAVEGIIALLASHGSAVPPALVWFVASRLRILLGAREVPKFALVRVLGHIRAGLVASGADLVELGVIERPDDVMFLSFRELRELAASRSEAAGSESSGSGKSGSGKSGTEPSRTEPSVPGTDLRARIAARRAAGEQEARRTQVPRLVGGDGHTWYEGLGDGAGGIVGSPVSPGVAEGRVRVVFDPATARLEPGEILVCPGTDPAWTPLFLAAAGLVTEVGGMMTHGSVIAREYGIPAVVGVHEATTRLVTGQLIRLDGSSGLIEVLG